MALYSTRQEIKKSESYAGILDYVDVEGSLESSRAVSV